MNSSGEALLAAALPVAPAARRLRPADGMAFLPAALEIVETPPSPIGRAIALSSIAAFCAALAWACLGKVDIVATAPGKIIPSGRTKIVQPFETGVVRAIHVHDGQTGQGGRRADRARSDDQRGRTGPPAERPHRRAARCRAAARGAGGRRSARRLSSARRRDPLGCSRPSASCCSTRPASSAPSSPPSTAQRAQKRGRAGDRRRDDRQDRGADPDPAAAGRHSQIPDGARDRVKGRLPREPQPAGRAAEGARRAEEPPAARPRRRSRQ